MPGFLMHAISKVSCFHLAGAVPTPPQSRVFVGGSPVLVMRDSFKVAGCPFTVPGPKAQPCVTVLWQLTSTRVFVDKQPAMVIVFPGPGPGVCQSVEQIPQGPPIVTGIQTRVFAR